MAELGEQMMHKINLQEKVPKKKKQPRVLEPPAAIEKKIDPIEVKPVKIDHIQEIERVRNFDRSKDFDRSNDYEIKDADPQDMDQRFEMFNDRFRGRYNLRDVKIVEEVIEL